MLQILERECKRESTGLELSPSNILHLEEHEHDETIEVALALRLGSCIAVRSSCAIPNVDGWFH